MPQFLSSDAQSLLRMLFKRNPANRLGRDIMNKIMLSLHKSLLFSINVSAHLHNKHSVYSGSKWMILKLKSLIIASKCYFSTEIIIVLVESFSQNWLLGHKRH